MSYAEVARRSRRADGPATIFAIGTAVPPNIVDQSTYPDTYFRVTKSEDKVELKEKFKRICDKSMVNKRHALLNDDMLKQNPNMCKYMAPSFDARKKIVALEIPKLGKEAAIKAIKEWGQPKSKITHLIFNTIVFLDIPGPDYELTKMLDLDPSIKRLMLYGTGCFAGGTVLRIAKDLAENNKGARVLVIDVHITATSFRGISDVDSQQDDLVAQAIFGDGASAMIIGSDPIHNIEKPIFEIEFAAQTILPNSDGCIEAHIGEAGLTVQLRKEVPKHITENIKRILEEAFGPLGISDWNSIFWVVHPGGPAILDQMEAKLGLEPKKLQASRHILAEYGNMSSVSVIFALDETRKRSAVDGLKSTGFGLEWGVLLGFGPGLTIETIVLRSIAT